MLAMVCGGYSMSLRLAQERSARFCSFPQKYHHGFIKLHPGFKSYGADPVNIHIARGLPSPFT